jgi:CheY-like chemotaxis protein
MFELPVLVVDDEPQLRSLIRTLLLKHGFRIVEASDGVSALSTVKKLNGAISLMVSDYSMPGMDGGALAQLVKAQFPAIPVLLMSSEAYSCDCRSGDAFLAKPFVPAILVDTVRRLYEREASTEVEQCA